MRAHARLAPVLALALFSAAIAQPSERCVLMMLKFSRETIEVASREEIESSAPAQYGTPQFAALFFELTGERGAVLYAGELIDPRMPACTPRADQVQGAPAPEDARAPEEGVAEVRFPALREARKFTIYRNEDGREAGRRSVLEVSL